MRWVSLALRSHPTEVDVCKCRLSVEQAKGYLAMCERMGKEDLIVECAFEKEHSAWSIRRVRDHKNNANALRTGWSTLESLVEDVKEEELVRRLRASKKE